MSWRSLLITVTALIELSLLHSESIRAQSQVALADRRPRFLHAAGPDSEPQPIDPGSALMLRQRVSLHLDGATLVEALAEITRQTGMTFVYSRDVFSVDDRVHVRAEQITLAAAMTEILLGAGVDILLSDGPRAALVRRASFALPLTQQDTVAGRVVDRRTRRPLEGAQVTIEGTGIRAVTDQSGRFRLADVPAGERAIVVALIGYGPSRQQVSIGSGVTVIANFELEQQVLTLDEVIVTGTAGGAQRRALGNSVATISAPEVVEVAGVRSPLELIGLRTPGVMVRPGSGQVGGMGAPIRIRGISSIMANEPLIYVDGIRTNNNPRAQPSTAGGASTIAATAVHRLNDISPEDIQSIEIIKGPAAATLYGTEASHGVIQILTKRGSVGAPTFDFMVRTGLNWMHNPAAWVGDENSIYGTDPTTGELLGPVNLYEHEKEYGEGAMFKTGILQYYSASVTGGTPAARYFFSLDWDDEEGIDVRNWGKRFASRANLDVLPKDNIAIRGSMGFVQRQTSFSTVDFLTTPLSMLVFGLHPSLPQSQRTRGLLGATPEAAAEVEAMSGVDRFAGSLEFKHQPFEWLSQRLVIGLDVTFESHHVLYPRNPAGSAYFFGGQSLGEKGTQDNRVGLYTVDYSATGKFNVTRQLSSGTSVGFQYYVNQQQTARATGRVFPTPDVTTIGGAAATTAFEGFLENKTLGLYFQEQLDFENRVFLTGAIRADNNSAFGADFKAALYPKVSAAWVVHEEPFWSLAPLISEFRLRAAFGAAGQQPDVFAAQRLYDPTTGPGNAATITPGTVGNPALKPERGEELEIGFDMGLWDGRAHVEFTHFDRRTSDAIISREIPPSLGFPGGQWVNIGRIKSWGEELGVIARLTPPERPVAWDIGVTAARNGNRIESLGDLQAVGTGNQRHIVGMPVGANYFKKVLSAEFVAGNRGPTKNEMCDGGTGPYGVLPGGEPVPCDVAPAIYRGPATPTWQIGLNSTITLFQNLSVFARVDATGGHTLFEGDLPGRITSQNNTLEANTKDNPFIEAYRKIGRSGLGWYKGGFAKLRELSATYRLPTKIAGHVGAARGSISVQARNVALLWQQQRHYDHGSNTIVEPERQGIGEFSSSQQVQYPPMKIVLLTVRLSY